MDSTYETGAKNHATNDFILTALNDEQCYLALKAGYKADSLYKNNSYLNSLDLNELDFPFINEALHYAINEEE